MGNPFFRQDEVDLSTALAGGIPMLSSVLSGGILPKLTGLLEQMDPALLEIIANQLSPKRPGRGDSNGQT
ncbi:MAG: hypothetical protein M0R49_00990 [Limnochordia bacterium]|jgi:hypothetical protein|nr:hypothetical protein [Limnochordia bacterium]